MFAECLERVKESTPLIHNITNYVTVNDVANILLAAGGSPIMTDEPDDVADITSICGGLNINIGTLNRRSIEAMKIAGARANELGHVVVLDPVGAGASSLRTEAAISLMEEISFTAIKGNISELKALATGASSTRGVDADSADRVTEDNLQQMVSFAKTYAQSTGSIIAITGAIDLISDGSRCFVIRNGRPEMGSISGTGCCLSAIMAAFLVANPGCPLEAAAAATAMMGLSGEIGWSFIDRTKGDGTSSYRMRIIDAVSNLTPEELEKGARYEIR
jgi:hydroxyethylthiazole kinase